MYDTGYRVTNGSKIVKYIRDQFPDTLHFHSPLSLSLSLSVVVAAFYIFLFLYNPDQQTTDVSATEQNELPFLIVVGFL